MSITLDLISTEDKGLTVLGKREALRLMLAKAEGQAVTYKIVEGTSEPYALPLEVE